MATYKRYLTHNFLKREYEENKRSCLDIAREVGCSSVTVHNYLKKFSIPRRSKIEGLRKKRAALTEEQKMIRDTAREVAEKVLAPRAAELDRTGTFPRENMKALEDQEQFQVSQPHAPVGLGDR